VCHHAWLPVSILDVGIPQGSSVCPHFLGDLIPSCALLSLYPWPSYLYVQLLSGRLPLDLSAMNSPSI
jgi:hypothetical protein